MALERKPQNLRGYGLAQDPKVELDTSFVDDQNRRMYQKKGIEAQQEAQQKNFAQRDKEFNLKLLSNVSNIKDGYSPQITKSLDDGLKGIYNDAGDGLSGIPLMKRLSKYNSQVAAYNAQSEEYAKRATELISGKTVAGRLGSAILNRDEILEMEGLDLDGMLAFGGGVLGSDYANTLDETEIAGISKQLEELAKQEDPTFNQIGSSPDGKKWYQTESSVPEDAREASVDIIMANNSNLYRILSENDKANGITRDYRAQIKGLLPTVSKGAVVSDKPYKQDSNPKGFRATGSGWADGVYNYTKGSGSSETNNPDAIGELSKQNAEGETIIETIGYENVVISRDNKDIAVKEIPFYDKDGELINGSIREIRQYPNGYKEIVVSRDGMTELLPYEKNKAILLGEYNLSESRVGEMLKKENGTKESEVGRSNNQKSAIKAFGQEKFDGLSDDLKKKFLEKYK